MSIALKNNFRNNLLILVFLFTIAFCNLVKAEEISYDESIKKYDNLLTSNFPAPKKKVQPIGNIEYLTFEHERLPNLEGKWLLTKTTVKRLNPDIILKKPTTFYHCTTRMPIENKDIINKKIIVTARGVDDFVFNPKFLNTKDIYHDGTNRKDIEYINFGFKGEIDPYDLSYAYTMKTNNHIHDNPSLARQMWLNGKSEYKVLTKNFILANGYEVTQSPECMGFILDQVEIKLVRDGVASDGIDEYHGRPIFGTPAYAQDRDINAPGLQLDSAKDKSGFNSEDVDKYKDQDSSKKKVPGMW